jgi:hypothetical protein
MITRAMLRVVAEQARSLRYDLTSTMPSSTDIDALAAAAIPALIREAARDLSGQSEHHPTGDIMPDPAPDPSPSDVAYDDMTRAWRNEDYPLAWNLADVLLQYLANGGQPLTGDDRDVYYARRIRNEALEVEGH